MNSYIVRIYREEPDNPRQLVGIIEEIGKNSRLAFTTLDELWEILNPAKRSKQMIESGMERNHRRKVDEL